MRNQKHTAEPWEAVTPCPGECCWHIQQVGNDNPMDMINNPEMSRADARRIVACVNACAGIDIKSLEPLGNLATYTRGIKIQRDELLAALIKAESLLSNCILPTFCNKERENIKAAIAKAEAGL